MQTDSVSINKDGTLRLFGNDIFNIKTFLRSIILEGDNMVKLGY